MPRCQAWTADDRRRRIPEMLWTWSGSPSGEHVRLGKYSKGMLQRVGLAQALIHSPQLLILDEPTDGVDPVGRRQIREILHGLEEKGATIFINSHLLQEVELFCEEVAILRKGSRRPFGPRLHDLTKGKGYRLTAAAFLILCARNSRRSRAVPRPSGTDSSIFNSPIATQVNAADRPAARRALRGGVDHRRPRARWKMCSSRPSGCRRTPAPRSVRCR